MLKKICKRCNDSKEVCEFGVNRREKDNLNTICKICDRLNSKNYRINNKEKIKNKNSIYYSENKDKILNNSKEYYNKNREKIIDRVKTYYQENLDLIKQTKKIYREKNKEKLNKQSKEYSSKNRKLISQKEKYRRKNDNLFRTIKNSRNRINKILKLKNFNKKTKTLDLIGCSPQFFKLYIESLFTEGMSWDLMGQYIHIDHIIPLSSAKTEDEIYKLCHYTNLQPLWAEDNLKKANKIIN